MHRFVLNIAVFIFCFVGYANASLAQSFSFENSTTYLSEIVGHNSENEGENIHFIGWFLNTSSFKLNESHSLNIGLMLTHGGEPSANIVGDLQVFSNLEAGFLYGFNEVYYQYEKEDFWVKLGQVDINTDFILSESGLMYTHSSFGIDPGATLNMPAPTYPVTALSLSTQIPIHHHLKLKLGVFDGQFAQPKNDFLTIDWTLNKDEGLLFIIEPEFSLFDGRLIQKVGFYHHSGLFLDRAVTDNIQNQSPLKRGLSTLYTVSDLNLKTWANGKKLDLFLQTAWSEKRVSLISNYLGFGVKASNFIESLPQNEIGIAIASANVNSEGYNAQEWNNLASETVIEVTYKQQIKEWLNLQPYFQYIGMKEIGNKEKNPSILGFRMNWEF